MFQSYVKDPQAELDYSFDWSKWLPEGDTIALSVWGADDGIEIMDAPVPGNTGTVTTVWIKGGTVGSNYNVKNTIVTNQGRTDERTIIIRISEK